MAVADFCCGAECGIVSSGLTHTPLARHWNGVSGTAPTAQTSIARNGGKAYRWQLTAGTGHVERAITGTTRWARFYIRFVTLPDVDTFMCRFQGMDGTDVCQLKYRTATQDLIIAIGATTTGATAVPVTTGVWYRIEAYADVGTGTREMGWTVDGVSKGAITKAVTATTLEFFRLGTPGTSVVTTDFAIDDIITGTNNAEYPVGAGQIIGLIPNADGTHSFNTAGDFIYDAAGANVATDATDTYSWINHTLESISTFLNAANAATGEYLEWQMTDMPAVTSIAGLEVVSSHHAASATANLQSMRMVDGATVQDHFTDVDFSQSGICFHSHHYAVAPSSSAAWTKAKVDALKFRWGSSWTAADVSPDAYIDGLMVEVDYIPGTATTRLYITQGVATAISPAVDAGWERNCSNFARRRSTISKTETSGATVSALFGSTSTSQTCWVQSISPPLAGPTTIDQPVSMVMRCQENSIAENAHLAFVLRVLSQDGTTIRGTLKSQMTTATEFPTSGATRIHSALATASVAALAGDRLVMEVGAHGVTPANVDSLIFEYGANMTQPDHTLVEGDTNSYNGWFEIAQALTFDPEPYTGSAAMLVSLGASIAGTGSLTFVGTGAVATSLGSSISGDGTLAFGGSGALVKTLGSSISGAAVLTFPATGALVKTLGSSISGSGTVVPPTPDEPPPASERARGGRPRVRFVDESPEKPVRSKPKPKAPPVPEAAALADVPRSMEALFGPSFDPAVWFRMAQYRPEAPYFAPAPAPAPQIPISERFMADLMQQLDAPQMPHMTHDQFLEQFLRQLGETQ